MKKLKHLWILILLFGLVSMVACGSPSDEQEPPQNQEVVVNCAETIAAHQYLLKQHEELKAECERLKSREGEYLTAVSTLENANLAQGIELAILKGLEEQRVEGYEDLLNELVTLRAERKDWGILASQEYKRILEEYNGLAALYPPRNFPDKATLVDWRAKSGNITQEKPLLVLQKLAMNEGYLVSVCPTHSYCVAIAGDYWYKLTTDDKHLVEKLGKVE